MWVSPHGSWAKCSPQSWPWTWGVSSWPLTPAPWSHRSLQCHSKFFKPGFNNTWTINFQMFSGFTRARGTRDQIANIHWIITKAREFQKNIYFSFIEYAKAFDCVDHNKRWKLLKEMGIPDHLTCLLRNVYAGQEATVRTGHGTTDWFQIGKGVCQGCILLLCLFNLYAEYLMRNAGLESRFPGEISITSDIQMIPT